MSYTVIISNDKEFEDDFCLDLREYLSSEICKVIDNSPNDEYETRIMVKHPDEKGYIIFDFEAVEEWEEVPLIYYKYYKQDY